jgi:hypothetical protein
MTERREKYHAVNSQWPDVVPELDGPEAVAAAKRLYRFAMKRPWRGKWKIVSGNRYTWTHQGVFCVNPKYTGRGAVNGWHDLVHFMSHYCHRRLFPKAKPHGPAHHFLEKEMVAYVLKHGWLDGKLKRKPGKARAKPDAVARLEASEKRWTTKLRRATTALRKISRQRAALARREAATAKQP